MLGLNRAMAPATGVLRRRRRRRPGDTDGRMTGLDGPSFVQFAKLSGLVPVVALVSGYCFAGNARMLGCCDVIIATKNASIGMGGRAMIEVAASASITRRCRPVSFQGRTASSIFWSRTRRKHARRAEIPVVLSGALASWRRGSAPAAAPHPGKPAAGL